MVRLVPLAFPPIASAASKEKWTGYPSVGCRIRGWCGACMALPIRSDISARNSCTASCISSSNFCRWREAWDILAGKDEQGRGISAEIPRLVRHDHDLSPWNEQAICKRKSRRGRLVQI